MYITPAAVKARRLALGLNQTAFAAEVAATYRAYHVAHAPLDAVRISKIENGNPDPGTLLACSFTLQRLESK